MLSGSCYTPAFAFVTLLLKQLVHLLCRTFQRFNCLQFGQRESAMLV
jgi:hypothetical protein